MGFYKQASQKNRKSKLSMQGCIILTMIEMTGERLYNPASSHHYRIYNASSRYLNR
ncbi:hypothetical protein Lfee_2648 [Legionella feeleii]|uniref:Uncharacterized protein n=1 Tax=Legionella feeleii TaxID=453 RepID=A0A0W0THA8_9GAMM|nr:hypothetical protein Lfee_2648 [Legionella feeleii]SPX61092.1 Uncharacterised protein [Legionella feeleii]